MADLHNQKLKKNKLIPLKYSWDEANERRAKGLCIFCEEEETPLHHLKHKRLVLVIVGGDDDDDELSGDGVLDEKEVSDRDSSTQYTQSSNGVLDENQVSETKPSIQELVMDDVSDPFSGEEQILETGSSILVTEETKAVLNERMILKESLLLDNSWDVMKSAQTTEIHDDLVQEDESYMVIGSDVKTYYSPQSQVLSSTLEPSHMIYNNPREILKELPCFDMRKDEVQYSYDCDVGKTEAVQMFDQMSSVITRREKYMRRLKSWKFKFKAREQAIKVLWQYSLGGKKCVDVIMQFHGCLNFIINPLKLESSSTIEAAAGLVRFVASVNSHREFIAKSGALEEIMIASEIGFEIFKRTQSRVYVHEKLSSSGKIIERKYKVLKLLDFKRGCEGCSQDSKVAVKQNILNLITKPVQMVKLEKDPHDAFALIIDEKTTLATGDGAIDVGMIQEADIGVDISGIGGMQAVVGGSELNVDNRVWDPGGFQLQEISIRKAEVQ